MKFDHLQQNRSLISGDGDGISVMRDSETRVQNPTFPGS